MTRQESRDAADHDRIWLEPKCNPERCWCQDRLEDCHDCGAKAVEYVRADIHDRAILAAEQRGEARGLEKAAKIAEAWPDRIEGAGIAERIRALKAGGLSCD